ncbi:MAG: DNA glycosylase AlkZ-like family protein, partial [Actinomycetota bacterium]
MTSIGDVIAQRLRIQRLTSEALPDAADVVRLLLCVQAQDAPLARFSIGMRTVDGTEAVMRRAVDDGRILRTHILRPTWHFVAAEDLRWLLT